MGRLSNPAVDFVQRCDQDRHGRECRGAARCRVRGRELRSPAWRPLHRQPHQGARTSRSQVSLGGRLAPSSALRMSHGPQVSIATGSHSLRSANDSESTIPPSARQFGERMCRFAQDAVGRGPERGSCLAAASWRAASCLGRRRTWRNELAVGDPARQPTR
jgi:hypothetical protein